MSEIVEIMKEENLKIDRLIKESSLKNLKPQISEERKKYLRNFLYRLEAEERQRALKMTWENIHCNFCIKMSKKMHIVSLNDAEKKTLTPFVRICNCGFIFIIKDVSRLNHLHKSSF